MLKHGIFISVLQSALVERIVKANKRYKQKIQFVFGGIFGGIIIRMFNLCL